MTGRNSKDKKHCKKWSTVRRHLILFAQKHIKIVQFLHKAPPCNGQVCILCCTSGPLARTAPPGGRRDRRPASPASTHSSHLRASPSSFPPLPPKSMLGGVAWAPGAMLPRPRPSFPTLISGGGGGKQDRDAAEMLTLLHNFASRRISLSGYAALASQKCSFSIKIKSRSSRL